MNQPPAERGRAGDRREAVPPVRESLDTDRIAASYDQGVLTLRIPVAEQAKPRKVEITAGTDAQPANSTSG